MDQFLLILKITQAYAQGNVTMQKIRGMFTHAPYYVNT
ncbi:tape measure protein [Parabacteroides bouchesdurhonensis]